MSRDALVVGISAYEYRNLGDLKTPAADAEAVARRLESGPVPFRVSRLPVIIDKSIDGLKTGRKTGVTLKQLKTALINLFNPAGDSHADTVLFYFSGHGLYDESMRKGYLATSDVDPDQEKWGYALSDLRQLVQVSRSRRQIIWLDCCHSGSLFAVSDANPGEQAGYSRCFIAGSREFERTYELVSGEYSVLTEALLQGLDPARPPGRWISTLELSAYLDHYLKQKRQTYPQNCLFLNVGEPIELTWAEGAPAEAAAPLQPDLCPYRALEAFEFSDAGARFFFGRRALTDELLGKIAEQPFLIVLGPSGSGKSSVVRAGLLREIQAGVRRSGTDVWEILPIIKPGDCPLLSLAGAFVPEAIRTKKAGETLGRAHLADLQERGAQALVELVAEFETTVVLVIDQFEELFTLCNGGEQERVRFLEILFGALDQLNGKLRLVATMRADFLGRCLEQPYAGLAERLKTCRVDITPLTEAELEEVIVQPAEQVGLQVARDLVERIKTAVRQSPGSLPLLQYALTELWRDWRQTYQPGGPTELTLASYERIGGVEGALEQQANQVYERFADDPIRQGLIQRIFLELVQPGADNQDTRRRVRLRELSSEVHGAELVEEVLQELVQARLVVTDEIQVGERSEAVVDLAHEATIRHWGKLRRWLDQHRQALPLIRQLRQEAAKWQTRGVDPEKHWLRGVRLEEAEACLASYGDLGYFDRQTEEFIQLSQQTWIAEETEKEKQIIEALRMSAEVLWRDNQQLESLMALVRAGRRLQETKFVPDNAEKVRFKLHETLYQRIHEKNRLQGHGSWVTSVAFSPDGQTLASASLDNTVKLWNLQGQELLTLSGHNKMVTGVAFSPDGQTLASASDDDTVKLWNLQGEELLTLSGHDGRVNSIAFSPDGQTLASASGDQTVRLWNLQGQELLTLFGHSDAVHSVAFSPDGQTLASAGSNTTVKLWNLQGEELLTLPEHRDTVRSIAFSPDGLTLALASRDRTVKLWNLQGEELLAFSGHSHVVTSIAFSPDGQTLASASRDRTVKLWSLQGQRFLTLLGHSHMVTSVAFSPDGQTLASASEDNTVKLWNLRKQGLRPLSGHSDAVYGVAFSPDGQTLASASFDNTVKLWNLQGEELFTSKHGAVVRSIAFSPDGQTLASASDDKTVRLWNLQGQELLTLPGHSDAVWSVAFSPDGQALASAGYDTTVKLWNLQGQELLTLSGHSDTVRSVAFSPDGQTLASASFDKTVKLWKLRGQELLTLSGHSGTVCDVTLSGHSGTVYGVAFSPDGQTLASVSFDKTVKLWNLQGKELLTLSGHRGTVYSVAFSPDGQTLASASGDKTVKLWSLQGEELLTFSGHSDTVHSVAFSPDGRTLASVSDDSTVKLWDLSLDSLVQKGCVWLQDYLTHNPNVSASDRKLCEEIGQNRTESLL